MIEQHFRRTSVQRRLQKGPLGEVVESYVRHLEVRGYSTSTIQQYTRAAEHFALWGARSKRKLADADEVLVRRFLVQHLPRCRCTESHSRAVHSLRAALHQLLVVIRPDACRRPEDETTCSAISDIVGDFKRYLMETCGAALATIRYYAREARALLVMRFGEQDVDLALMRPDDASAFVLMRAKTLTPASTNVVATAVRGFIRYLQFCGVATSAWIYAVPQAANWRLSHVPRVLTDEEVDAFLASFDPERPHGRRDYAMALCLLDLGLRASDVAGITLDALNWRAQTVTIAAGKTRCQTLLPLPDRVANALVDYLRHSRPQTSERSLFVHHRPPCGEGIGPAVVRSAVRLAYARAGLDSRLTGTHVLRHTLATRLLRSGASTKEIADVLGHRSLESTVIYAKVDLSALAAVALRWPEMHS